jgi:serine/threonine protein kinase/Tfp pilus assembly protein PilF
LNSSDTHENQTMSADLNQARSIFLTAVENHPSAEWDAFVTHACAGNEDLRQRVAVLLRAHAQSNSLLDQPGTAIVSTLEAPILEAPGTRIGPYKLHEQIGEGFGVVFMAEQQEPIRRKVAVKIVKPGMDSQHVIARFEAERQALALMDHPNIAKVLDAGQTPTGRPYFVMDLIKGLPITEFCDQSRLTPKERLKLFADVCRAVQHAHQKGIIHRDLKPSNVLVTLQDGTPLVKVIDFGIAKAMGQQLTSQTLLTGFAQTIGTPLYMPPEQTALSNADVDTRSDIYSLGVLLYELLTGTTPFEKARLHQAGFDEMRRIISEEEPPKPSTRLSTLGAELSTVSERRGVDPRKLSRALAGELDWIVMKALEKDRNRRYETASALAADVERYLTDEPVRAGPPTAAYRLRKFARRHRGRLRIVATLLLFLAALAGVIGWEIHDQAARDEEVARQVRAREEATAQAVAEDLREADTWQKQEQWARVIPPLEHAAGRLVESGLSSLKALVEERRRDATLIVRLEEARLKASEISLDGNRDYTGADRAYGAAFADHGLDVVAVPAEEIAQHIKVSAIRSQLVAALDYWAHVKERLPQGMGEPLRAIARSADDDAWRRQLRDPQTAKDREALERLAEDKNVVVQPATNLLVLTYLLDRAKASGAMMRLLHRAQERYPADFWINLELGSQLRETSATTAEAVGFLRVALGLQPRSPVVYNMLGVVLLDQRKFSQAEAAFRRAAELKPSYAGAFNNLGIALYNQRRLSEAAAAYSKAIELQPDQAGALHNLSQVLHDRNRLSEAEAVLRKAIKLDPNFTKAHNDLGIILRGLNKRRDSEEAHRKALELKGDDARAYSHLGVTLELQQRLSEAEAAHRKAIELEPESAMAHVNIAGFFSRRGKLPEAEAAYRKAIALRPEHALAYSNFAYNLENQGKYAEAEAGYRKAIELEPNSVDAHNRFGGFLGRQKRLADAEATFRKVIELDLNYAEAHVYLGHTLRMQGQFPKALASFKRSQELGFADAARWVATTKQFADLDAKLPKILQGEIVAGTTAERLALAELCHLPCRQLYAASARFYGEAYAADPKLANNLDSGHNYDAACAAALAGCGQGKDAANLDAKEYARLRGQALVWLRADLAGRRSELEKGPEKARRAVWEKMQHWYRDSELNGVRGEAALAKLPEAERHQWEKLWQDVKELESRAFEPQAIPGSK